MYDVGARRGEKPARAAGAAAPVTRVVTLQRSSKSHRPAAHRRSLIRTDSARTRSKRVFHGVNALRSLRELTSLNAGRPVAN